MQTYQIITDSSCDLPEAFYTQLGVQFVPFYVSLDGKTYEKELVELQLEDFFQRLAAGRVFPKTSLPTVQDYTDAFTPALEKGQDVFCFCLTAKFSGSYQSAVIAADMLREAYPDRRIVVFDSMLATAGQGLLVREAARMQAAGFDIDALLETLPKIQKTAKINFTIESLDYLKHGGRIGKASALAGSILNIKPVITMINGELQPAGKVRGAKKAIQTVLDMTVAELGDRHAEYQIGMLRGNRPVELSQMREAMQAQGISVLPEDFLSGVTIAAHAGPTVLGICYLKKYECV